jgi:hypothetical protein
LTRPLKKVCSLPELLDWHFEVDVPIDQQLQQPEDVPCVAERRGLNFNFWKYWLFVAEKYWNANAAIGKKLWHTNQNWLMGNIAIAIAMLLSHAKELVWLDTATAATTIIKLSL